MSRLYVNEIVGVAGTGAVTFLNGIAGDGSQLSYKPQILSFSPSFTATNVAISTNITITFSQTVQFLGVGTINIREGSPSGTITTSFTCGVSTRATINGNVLTIDPVNDLAYNTLYFVTLPSVGIANTFGAYYEGSSNYQFRTQLAPFSMSGGSYVYTRADPASPTGYYKYHIFLATGPVTFDTPSLNANDFAALLVAGGGGGNAAPPSPSGAAGGGGGAGGVISYTGPTLAIPGPASYTVSIGAGGFGWNPPTSQPNSTNGNNTAILSSPTVAFVSAVGGGRGGGFPNPGTTPPTSLAGAPGGSGGGGGVSPAYPFTPVTPTPYGPVGLHDPGGVGTPGQGNAGGRSARGISAAGISLAGGGGGGGAGGVGSNGSWPGFTAVPFPPGQAYGGTGGPGIPIPAFGQPVFSGYVPTVDLTSTSLIAIGPTGLYGGGGGGGAPNSPTNSTAGNGGPGGGGHGAFVNPSYTPFARLTPADTTANNGVQYTGGGGGGGAGPTPIVTGGNGGAGVAMFRYAVPSTTI